MLILQSNKEEFYRLSFLEKKKSNKLVHTHGSSHGMKLTLYQDTNPNVHTFTCTKKAAHHDSHQINFNP